MDIQLVLEISVIATVISTVTSYFTFRKTSSLTYVTQERKEWREAIRNIAVELEQCPYKKRGRVLVKLKTRINAYGRNRKNELQDAHIWQLIGQIEACEPDEYDPLKNQLVYYLSVLLKYDWERSKKEVYGNPLKIISFLFALLALVIFAMSLIVMLGKDVVAGLPLIVAVVVVLVGLVMLAAVALKDKNVSTYKGLIRYLATKVALLSVWIYSGRQLMEILDSTYLSAAIIIAFVAWGIQLLAGIQEILDNIEYCVRLQKEKE